MKQKSNLFSSFAAVFTLLVVALTFAPSSARSDSALDFVLVNDTGYTIDKIFVSPSKTEEWGEDVMGQDQLEDGKSVKIHFNRAHEKDTKWDIKVVFTDNENRYWTNLDLSTISEVTIHYKDDHATATWK
jgi:hypothetical protein